MDGLREHMRDHIASFSAADSEENILNFRCPPFSAKNAGAAALDLVYQAADLFKGVEDHAAERQARAESLVKLAIEELEVAKGRVRSAESERRAAEAGIEEVSVKVQQIEKVLERATSSMAAAEAQISAAEQRARTAEMRANEAENALKRIENALRTQILDKRQGHSRRAAKAA